MPTTAQDFDQQDMGESVPSVSVVDACQHDAYWERVYWHQSYYNPQLDYEDYAPAYCVGYIGHAQYGGRFEDAERSLCANWERIKGDSRLAQGDALLAMRAAWDRRDGTEVEPAEEPVLDVAILAQSMLAPSFGLSTAPVP